MNPEASEREVLERLPGAIVAVSEDDVVIYASSAALGIVGWDRTLLGMPLTTIIPRRLQSQHLEAFQKYVETGVSKLQGHPVRVPARRRDGSEVDVDLTIRLFLRPDQTKLAVASLNRPASGGGPLGLQVLEDEFRRRLYELV